LAAGLTPRATPGLHECDRADSVVGRGWRPFRAALMPVRSARRLLIAAGLLLAIAVFMSM
jgi:hypothetical protein